MAVVDGAHVSVPRGYRDVGCVLVTELVEHLHDFGEVGSHFGVLDMMLINGKKNPLVEE